jgi:hypothetical protein
MTGLNGANLKYEEVYLRAVTLLKNIINEQWDLSSGNE